MRKFRIIALSGLAAAGVSLGIVAAPETGNASATYNFKGGPSAGVPSLSFAEAFTTLNVTATTTGPSGALVTQNNNSGLGACSISVDVCTNAGNAQLDSIGAVESLRFQVIGAALSLETISFDAYNLANANRDRFQLFVDGVEITSGAFKPAAGDIASGPPRVWDVVGSFGPVIASNEFVIQAASFGGSNSAFRVSGLSGTQIPEPATLSLLAAGLAGVGFVAWRRKRKAA